MTNEPWKKDHAVMCDRCDAIERQLLHYRKTLSSITDELAISLLDEVIKDLETEKSSLHPGSVNDNL